MMHGHYTHKLTVAVAVAVAVHARPAQNWTPCRVIMNEGGTHEALPFLEELPAINGWWRGCHFLQWYTVEDVLAPQSYLPHMLGPKPLIKLSGPRAQRSRENRRGPAGRVLAAVRQEMAG